MLVYEGEDGIKECYITVHTRLQFYIMLLSGKFPVLRLRPSEFYACFTQIYMYAHLHVRATLVSYVEIRLALNSLGISTLVMLILSGRLEFGWYTGIQPYECNLYNLNFTLSICVHCKISSSAEML